MHLRREAIRLLELIPMPDMQADDRLLPAHGLFRPLKFAQEPSAGLHHEAQELPSPPRPAVRWQSHKVAQEAKLDRRSLPLPIEQNGAGASRSGKGGGAQLQQRHCCRALRRCHGAVGEGLEKARKSSAATLSLPDKPPLCLVHRH